MTLLLPRPGKSERLADGSVVADADEYDVDSTSVLASSVWAALWDRRYKATFIVPLEHFDYAGVGQGKPNSAVVKQTDLISALDAGLQGKVRVDFMKPLQSREGKLRKDGMVAQLTFTRKSSAAYFKLMFGGR